MKNKNQITRWIFAGMLSALASASAQVPQKPAVVTPQKASAEAVDAWRAARFGMFIHWGPVSLTEKELSWSRANSNPMCPNHGPTPVAVYDNLYKKFNPTKFNAKEWVATAKAAGMKYIVLTAKHCDGFLLWDSKVDDYNIMHTPFKRDVCAELAKAAHDAGMKLGWYFSPIDWRDPDCRNEKNDEFVKRMQAEITELLTNYGKIDILWFDWDAKESMWHPETTYPLVRRLQPNILINNRLVGDPMNLGPWTDFVTPEQTIGSFDLKRPWESCMTVSKHDQWAWGGSGDGVKSFEQCMNMLIRCAGSDGNMMLNVGPMPTGEIAPEQAGRIKEMGAWLSKNGESIYGTRGGPWKPTPNIVSTRKGDQVYLHLMQKTPGTFHIAALPVAIKSAKILNGPAIKTTTQDGELSFEIPENAWEPIDTIVELTLTDDSMKIAPLTTATGILGAKASASVFYQNSPQFDAAKAIDGDPETRWATPEGTKQCWLQIDFAKETSFNSIEIDEAYGRVLKFELQKKDGDSWTTFHEGTSLGEHFKASFVPVTTKAIRLNILDATDGPSISEICVRNHSKKQ